MITTIRLSEDKKKKINSFFPTMTTFTDKMHALLDRGMQDIESARVLLEQDFPPDIRIISQKYDLGEILTAEDLSFLIKNVRKAYSNPYSECFPKYEYMVGIIHAFKAVMTSLDFNKDLQDSLKEQFKWFQHSFSKNFDGSKRDNLKDKEFTRDDLNRATQILEAIRRNASEAELLRLYLPLKPYLKTFIIVTKAICRHTDKKTPVHYIDSHLFYKENNIHTHEEIYAFHKEKYSFFIDLKKDPTCRIHFLKAGVVFPLSFDSFEDMIKYAKYLKFPLNPSQGKIQMFSGKDISLSINEDENLCLLKDDLRITFYMQKEELKKLLDHFLTIEATLRPQLEALRYQIGSF